MKLRLLLPPLALALLFVLAGVHRGSAAYELTADSKPQPGVPKGEVLHFTFEKSKIFPGTFRDYWVYVPAEYTPDKPACLYVNQDGVGWNAPTVFDNLIYKKEMPVTIGVFVMHGRVRAADGALALDRFNRSYEYDGLGDNYARFLIEELLPEVETKKASDGRPIRISHDGNDHAIGGGSSGAVCAFTAAWERPDQFSRVFSAIGTYVGLRGAEVYPTLIRKYEAKPIRVFLQDGSADQNIYGGDWWMANQMMERALTFAGYEVNHVWGEGGHSGEQGAALFPDAMRWLWKDWPQPVKTHRGGNAFLNEILLPDEGWQLHRHAGAVETRLGRPTEGPDGRTYLLSGEKLYVTDASGKRLMVVGGLSSARELLVVSHQGNVYLLERGRKESPEPKIVLLRPDGRKTAFNTEMIAPEAVTISPDQTLLYVSDRPTHWVYSYQIHPDGTLGEGQRYYWLHTPDTSESAAASGMCVDRDGRLYVATKLGIQICDQAGRVNCILPLPGGRVPWAVSFTGENSDVLWAECGDVSNDVFSRKLRIRGAHAWEAPNKPAAPRL